MSCGRDSGEIVRRRRWRSTSSVPYSPRRPRGPDSLGRPDPRDLARGGRHTGCACACPSRWPRPSYEFCGRRGYVLAARPGCHSPERHSSWSRRWRAGRGPGRGRAERGSGSGVLVTGAQFEQVCTPGDPALAELSGLAVGGREDLRDRRQRHRRRRRGDGRRLCGDRHAVGAGGPVRHRGHGCRAGRPAVAVGRRRQRARPLHRRAHRPRPGHRRGAAAPADVPGRPARRRDAADPARRRSADRHQGSPRDQRHLPPRRCGARSATWLARARRRCSASATYVSAPPTHPAARCRSRGRSWSPAAR